jgi:hypothetical protein
MVMAKTLRIELLQIKADLERELGGWLLDCMECKRRVHWGVLDGSGARPLGALRARTEASASVDLNPGSEPGEGVLKQAALHPLDPQTTFLMCIPGVASACVTMFPRPDCSDQALHRHSASLRPCAKRFALARVDEPASLV